MKILLLFCLIKYFISKIYDLKRYGSTEVILNDIDFVIFNITAFSPGDSIYLTLKSVDKEFFNYIEYTFSKSYQSPSLKIDQIKYAYSEDYKKHEHKYSTGVDILFDYYYYFEFIKSENDQKYIIMQCTKTSKDDVLLNIENTKYRRYVLVIIVVNVIAGILFIITLIIFIIKYPCCRKSLKKIVVEKDFDTPIENNSNLSEEINYPGSTITNYGNNVVEEKQNQCDNIYDKDSAMNCYPSPD